jgi:inward rectifier potassium channel
MRIRRPIPRSTRKEDLEDLGFGNQITGQGSRLIRKDGSFNVDRVGRQSWTPYQSLVEMSWSRFIGVVLFFFIGVNAVFALLFLFCGVDQLSGVLDGHLLQDFANCFFLSVQTFTTVGYGAINPEGLGANIVASLCALVGLISFALATGLFFARFSKPKAQILFSDHAVIAPYRDLESFQFRIANRRNNKIIDLVARVSMTWIEEESEHVFRRRFASLPLEREKIFMFPLNWTLVHPITPKSPLYDKTPEDLKKMDAEFLILIEGHDETFAQTVHTTGSYTWKELVWNARFTRRYFDQKDGQTILELDRIDEFEEVDQPRPTR